MIQQLLFRHSRVVLAIALVVPVVLIGIPAVMAVRAETEVKNSFRWVTHTLEVEAAVQSLVSSLVDAETGQRGFLLTHKPAYLEPYEAARERIPQQLRELRALTADNPAQQERLTAAEKDIQNRVDLLAETVRLGLAGDYEAALTVVNSDRGKAIMDRIRGQLREMSDDERRLVWVRQRNLSNQARRSTAILWLLAAGSALCGAGLFYLLKRLSRVEPVVQMCAASRTIEYQGEWLSFEEYLERRFKISTRHGVSPAEIDRLERERTGVPA
jgi:CHASE3 domain sensor protein